uniref:Reverse transcriptase domain-containing protein n=1 Tax=Macrostomum lignano TaxID=282301 RepID=A0A1I8FB26_9PLAT
QTSPADSKRCRRQQTAATAAGSSRRVKIRPAQRRKASRRSRQSNLLGAAGDRRFEPEQLTNVGQFQLTKRAAVRAFSKNFLGEEPAIMMAGAAQLVLRGRTAEQKYLRDTWRHDPRGSQAQLWSSTSPDSQSKGHGREAATNDTARGTEPGYLIRNWYSSRNHPLKRLEKNRHVKECRYCHSAVPWHALSQHEDECRSIMYGTTPTLGSSTAQMSTGFSSDLMQQLAELDAKISQPASALLFTTPANLGEPQLLMLNEGVNKLTILRQKLYFVKGKIMRSNRAERAGLPCQRPVHDWRGEGVPDRFAGRFILDQRFDLDEKLSWPTASACYRRELAPPRRLLQFASGFYSHLLASARPTNCRWWSMGNLELTFQQLVDGGSSAFLSTESQTLAARSSLRVITLRKDEADVPEHRHQLLEQVPSCSSLRSGCTLYAQNGVDLKHKEPSGHPQ